MNIKEEQRCRQLLVRYQMKDATLTEQERADVWLYISHYIVRCERRHYGAADQNDRSGSQQDRHYNRVTHLLWLLQNSRYRKIVNTPYKDNKGKTRYAKSCLLSAPLHPPGSILTGYRHGFARHEAVARLREDGAALGTCWSYNDSLEAHYIKFIAEHYRKTNGDLGLVLEKWGAIDKRVDKTQFKTLLLHYHYVQQRKSSYCLRENTDITT